MWQLCCFDMHMTCAHDDNHEPQLMTSKRVLGNLGYFMAHLLEPEYTSAQD